MTEQEIKNYARENSVMVQAALELTEKCNFSCEHCYCSYSDKKDMSFEDICNIIDKLCENDCLFLTLTGGEIFLRSDFSEIYKYIKERGFLVTLFTNAALINENIILLLKEFPPYRIYITLYGTNENEYYVQTGIKGSFNQVIHGLNLLKDNGIPFVLRSIATTNMYHSIYDKKFDKIAQHYSCEFYYDTIVFSKVNGAKTNMNQRVPAEEIIKLENNDMQRYEQWKNIFDNNEYQKHLFQCFGGKSSIFIDYKGDVSICSLYRTPQISLLYQSYKEVMNKLHQAHKLLMEDYNVSSCSKCENAGLCRWCPGHAVLENGDKYEKIDYFCELAELRRKKYGK